MGGFLRSFLEIRTEQRTKPTQRRLSLRPLLVAVLLTPVMLAACSSAAPEVFSPTITPQPPDRTSVILHQPPTPTVTPQPTQTVVVMPTDDPSASDLPDYYGGLVITLDYVGQTLFMKPGQGFLFQLGDSFNWEIAVDPPEILTINRRFTPQPGEQGVFIARERGKGTVKAIGSPKCLQNDPPCARPNVLFTLLIEVQ